MASATVVSTFPILGDFNRLEASGIFYWLFQPYAIQIDVLDHRVASVNSCYFAHNKM